MEGGDVKDHPVVKQLLRQRMLTLTAYDSLRLIFLLVLVLVLGVLLDKLKPLDAKLKYQIDNLLKVANSADPEESVKALQTMRRTPNLASFTKGAKGKAEDDDKNGTMMESRFDYSISAFVVILGLALIGIRFLSHYVAKYVAPKRNAMLLKGSLEEKQRKDERKLNSLSQNKMIKMLRNEYGDVC